jgi:hypothetical protein
MNSHDGTRHWLVDETAAALSRIRPHVHLTPLALSHWLSSACGGTVLLKLESEQVTASFKSRGAVNKLLSLSSTDLQRGLVTASTGNHALAFTYATSLLMGSPHFDPARCIIYLPCTASDCKLEKLRSRGANLRLHGRDSVEAELEALRVAGQQGMVWISPYNDREVRQGRSRKGGQGGGGPPGESWRAGALLEAAAAAAPTCSHPIHRPPPPPSCPPCARAGPAPGGPQPRSSSAWQRALRAPTAAGGRHRAPRRSWRAKAPSRWRCCSSWGACRAGRGRRLRPLQPRRRRVLAAPQGRLTWCWCPWAAAASSPASQPPSSTTTPTAR